jgi:hypothetical protein
MEMLLVLLSIVCLLYVLWLHRSHDRLQFENALLRDALHRIADGKANVYKYNDMIQIKEVE